ncbi:competence protein CoiA family protein [Yinghuangia sp. YIM S10712]|uniref:competence protein CoiA family protein n=1 Tax=Yinghuangia sp. YIM S10712 TaxID=3436930 RepID=UPI003F53DD5C
MTHTVYDRKLGVVLNLTLPDLGIDDGEQLLEELRSGYDPGRLYCLESLQHGGISCPGFMTIRTRNNKPHAMHVPFGEQTETAPESDEHKMLKDYTATTASREGFDADVEAWGPDRKRRTDVVVTGDDGRRIGYEIQLSAIAPGKVDRRTARAQRDGLTPLWVVTNNNAIPIDRTTWARVDVQTWRDTRKTEAFPVRGGVKALSMVRCDRRNAEPCPVRRHGRCGGRHASWDPVGLPYDDLIVRTAANQLVPLYMERSDGRRGWHMWVTPADKAEFLQGRPEPSPDAFRRRERASALRELSPKPDDPTCHYREEGELRKDLAKPRDSGAPIDASHWLSAPPEDFQAGGYTLPWDLVDLQRAWDTADATCRAVAERLPKALDVLAGRAVAPTDLRNALESARAERLQLTLELVGHPWWGTVNSRVDAQTALRGVARNSSP